MEGIFDAPEWLAALTLAERAALLAADGANGAAAPVPQGIARATRTLERWRRESHLLDDTLFRERLAADGLTPDLFIRALAEPVAGLRRRLQGEPSWLQLLARAFAAPGASLPPASPLPAVPGEGDAAGVGDAEFGGDAEGRGDAGDLDVLELFRPLIAGAYERVLDGLQTIEAAAPGVLDPSRVAATLLPALTLRLRRASERTLALELQASRMEGRLEGETPEARFRSFVVRLRQPAAALEILLRYPVLARDAAGYAEQWVEANLETVRRYATDRGEIVRRLGGGRGQRGQPGPLVAIAAGQGDYHAGGRSVAVLSFRSGFQVVYKPKPLAVDVCFWELIAWLNDRGVEPPLRRLAVVDRGSYGWVEHVAARPCDSAAEVERFYARQGAWVALFYVLEANDLHHENLIAAGEDPVPIDLETLFQPARPAPAASGPGFLPTADSVLNAGLLPRRFWATAGEGGLDVSGMGTIGGQTVGVRSIAGQGTDQMRWALHEMRLEEAANLPTLRGSPVSLWEHVEPVLRGFRATYRLLWRCRDELLAAGGPLCRFAGTPIRTLLRATSVYAHLLHVGHHPDYLQSAVDRDRLFDGLWLDAVTYSPLRPLVRTEREDLSAGDIPLWGSLADSTDLLHGAGRRVTGFFTASGMQLAAARLRALDEDDLERQSWLVHAAIEATRSLDERWLWPAASLPEAGAASPERFLAAARTIGDRIARLAIEQNDLVTWFHLAVRPDGWLLEPMPVDLYHGLAGVALFLAHLARRSGEERYERLARLAAGTARRRMEAEPGAPVNPGAFDGWGGVVYALTHLGILWGDGGMLDEAERLALRRAPEVERDENYDLMAGAAGAAAALLALHRHRPSPALLQAAVRCGERLLGAACTGERGWSWPPAGEPGGLPLTGFSHGAAGVAWVLAWLARESGDERFRAASHGAVRYERSWFSPEHGNWPDLRRQEGPPGPPDFLHAWCHGAPGVGLGRAAMLGAGVDRDPEMAPEIRAAVRSTLAEGFGGNQSLCHGDLGNLELIRAAGRVLDDAELAAEAERLAGRILARIEAGSLRCGTSPRTESLGLMVGLAGIGYGLLRAAYPEHLPCVLLLETP
jgi:type 2 lantibiotic biosynthesis protein LanM